MLGRAFIQAVEMVTVAFDGRTRKGSHVPYVSHLLEVAGLALVAGGDEEQAIAALLHDALEDVPDELTPELIGATFGPRVLAMVEACTDSLPGDPRRGSATWRERKERYLARLADASADALLVSLADKLANARALTSDARAQGPTTWRRFNAGPAEQRWFFTSLLAVFEDRLAAQPATAPLVADLRVRVAELAALTAEAEAAMAAP